jgi:hypothetical protein
VERGLAADLTKQTMFLRILGIVFPIFLIVMLGFA